MIRRRLQSRRRRPPSASSHEGRARSGTSSSQTSLTGKPWTRASGLSTWETAANTTSAHGATMSSSTTRTAPGTSTSATACSESTRGSKPGRTWRSCATSVDPCVSSTLASPSPLTKQRSTRARTGAISRRFPRPVSPQGTRSASPPSRGWTSTSSSRWRSSCAPRPVMGYGRRPGPSRRNQSTASGQPAVKSTYTSRPTTKASRMARSITADSGPRTRIRRPRRDLRRVCGTGRSCTGMSARCAGGWTAGSLARPSPARSKTGVGIPHRPRDTPPRPTHRSTARTLFISCSTRPSGAGSRARCRTLRSRPRSWTPPTPPLRLRTFGCMA
mmetsp:Transcript_13003/g.37463  ORF Transcript_13003/g.37463 Transcript_13003/m.37463 type:complete len:330 (+) Transcript_13003:1171-2160(+)